VAEFVIMGNAHEYCEVMCSDIIGKKDVVFINKPNNLKSNFGKLLDFLFQKLSEEAKLSLFPSIRYKSYFCGAAVPDGEDIRFIFFDSNAHAKDEAFLKYIRNKYKAKLVLYVMNPASAMELNPELCSNFYDSIFTVFSNDADSYGWNVCKHIYAKIMLEEPARYDGYDTDVFFAGRAKNRLQNILRTYKFLVSHDIKCDFHIFGVDKRQMRYDDDIKYNKWMPYKELLKRMRRSRCILEILQKHGEGPTLRMVEAIVYNKKIITNNETAAANQFYDERFVQIFDTPENLSLNFIKNDIEPDYHYRGEYSAINFLKSIEEHLSGHDKFSEKT
jgi:hypothetical protein